MTGISLFISCRKERLSVSGMSTFAITSLNLFFCSRIIDKATEVCSTVVTENKKPQTDVRLDIDKVLEDKYRDKYS